MEIYEIRRMNLRRLMDTTYGINARGAQTRMAERLNKPQNYLSRCLADKDASGAKKIGEQFAREIETAFDLEQHSLDFEGFLYAAGAAQVEPSAKEEKNNPPAKSDLRSTQEIDLGLGLDPEAEVTSVPLPIDPGRVPVLGKAMLGMDGYFDAMDYPVGHGDGFLNIHSNDPDAYALRVVGSSMTPRIKSGEFVLIEPNLPYLNGDDVLVKTASGRSMIKEFVYLRDGQYRFDSYGADHDPIYLDADEVVQIHFVGGIFKSYRYSPE